MQLESAMIRRLVIMIYDRLTSPHMRQELAEQLSPLLNLRADQIERSPEVFAEIACFKLVLECLVLQSTVPGEQFCDPEWGAELSHRCYAAFSEYYARRTRQHGHMLEEGAPQRLYDHICTYEKAVKSQGLAMAGTIFTQRIIELFGRKQKNYSGSTSTILTLMISSSILTNYWPEQFEQFEIAPDVDSATPVPVIDRRTAQRRQSTETASARRLHLVSTTPPVKRTARGGHTVLGFLQIGMERFLEAIGHFTESKAKRSQDELKDTPLEQWVELCDSTDLCEIDDELQSSSPSGSLTVGAAD